MRRINITSGEYLNNYLKNKIEGTFIPFSEAMIQGKLIYPLFDDKFIKNRAKVHNVSIETYIKNLKEFLSIKEYLNEVESITLWFGKDAFCIINLLTVLVFLEDQRYEGEIVLNLVDDSSCIIIESNISIKTGEFKYIYLNLMNEALIDSNYNFINTGLKDYTYITSNDNHIFNYIKENCDKMPKDEMVIDILNKTYEYGLGDVQIIAMIDKIKN